VNLKKKVETLKYNIEITRVTMTNNAPVFIVGCPRTGSKIYMRIINQSNSINITQEISLKMPKWKSCDLHKVAGRKLGKEKDISPIVSSLYSHEYYYCKWPNMGITLDDLLRCVESAEKNTKGIFESILTLNARHNNKVTIGAKFPVHLQYTDLLRQWYPDCRIIHIIRNPLAIFYSQIQKYSKTDAWERIKGNWIFQAINIYYYSRCAVGIHKTYKKDNNYLALKYEDTVFNPEEQCKKLCDFLHINFNKSMLDISVFDSSFISTNKVGILSEGVNRYSKGLSVVEKVILNRIFKTYIKMFGYT
jgi:hypothetical protein